VNGYIKLYRKLTQWEWYTDQNTFKLFIHCLLMANHKPNKWQGIIIDTGEFVTSFEKLKVETGLTIRQLRTSIKRLEMTSEIEHKTTSRFSVIKVLKWCDYQGSDEENDKPNVTQTTSKRQANDKQTTTNKNDKNVKNDKNKEYIGAFDEFSINFPQYEKPLREYKCMRVDMKKKMTSRAEELFIAKLKELIDKGYDGLALIDEALSKNWLSIYEPKKAINQREDVLPDFMNKPKREKLIYEVVEDEPIDRKSLIDKIKGGQ
jgi:hypothetical protein